MTGTIQSSQVKRVLDALYADALKSPFPAVASNKKDNPREFFHELRHVYMAIAPDFGHLLYSLVRASKAKTIVEFGTSMGVSTIYLAAGLIDNGGGRLITTEYETEKIDRARNNLNDAGLLELVEFRAGDALESLSQDLPVPIDLVFLDGAKEMYLDVLRLVEPHLVAGSVIAADNTDHEGVESLLAYLRDPTSGYVSSAIMTARDAGTSGHEIALRCG